MASAGAAEPVRYNRDIRPILSDNCFSCHGPDVNRRKAGLRLDVREEALKAAKSGAIAIVSGDARKSALLARINSKDADEVMPPPKSHKAVTAAQKEKLRQWIQQGAKYEQHWAFVPLAPVPAPAVKRAGWLRNDLDRFILARLERERLPPSPEAARETLIRRVSLDLTGLPPTVAEVDAFVADKSATAYEKVVERLLRSPHYGERMAVDWLDAARFADSNGYQVDRDRELWPWRDWVIRAFNDNKPFDQFTIEQLAGDLLPDATLDQRIATGFHRNHMMNEEGGIIAEEFLAEYTADRVETTAGVWLGQTFNCARCHDHKFDPFTQRDFYGLKAFFHNVSEKGIGSYGSPIRINSPPFLRLPTDEQTKKLTALKADIDTAKAQLAAATAEANSGVDEWARRLAADTLKWTPGEFVKIEAGKALTEVLGDGARIEAPNPGSAFTADCSVRLPAGRATALRIECADAGMSGSARWLDVRVFAGKQALKLRAVESGDSLAKAELTKTLDGSKLTFTTVAPREGKSISGVFELAEPVVSNGPIGLRVVIDAGYGSGPMLWRIATTDSDTELLAPTAIAALAKKDAATRTPAEKKRLADYRAQQSPALRVIDDRITALTQQKDALDREVQTTLVMEELPQPRKTFVLMRGAYDKPGDEVTAATPATLPALAADQPRNRLGLARWLVDPANPLPARVTVNRFWQSVFGTGLVKTAEDFGAQGEAPSHPELLDWLATEFVRTGWDVKAMMRLLVTSATYRQSSRLTPLLRERDPENRLLARGPRFRLSAEAIRDQALAASGLLIGTIGGPSVKPYHPPGLYEQIVAGSSSGTYVQGKDDDLHRRSLYTYWKRSVPNPAMLLFDAPFREACTLRRPRTNTPLQALNLMNDPTYVEASRFLAQRMMREGGDAVTGRLEHGFRLLLARSPKPAELSVLRAAYERVRSDFSGDLGSAKALLAVGEAGADAKLDPTELAAFTAVASTLLNLDEVVTKE
ncbi:MAG: PSD1 and planctomycete cytochrome C domain-containing protein [Limisphaerales bacterium]